MKSLALILLFLAWVPQDTTLVGVRAILEGLREEATAYSRTRGATPALTTAKHQLRDWIELRLTELGAELDVRDSSEALNEGISRADLFCTDFEIECGDNVLGYVDGVRLSRDGDFLVVVTSMGVWCGHDESAYVYIWEGGRWRRIWQTEQIDYTDEGYLPQTIHEVQISSQDVNGRRLLMTLGSQASCSGSFKDLYVRVWQMEADYQTESLLDRREYANDGYPPIRGQVRSDDVLYQFTAGGIIAGNPHWSVRHFQVRNGAAIQVDPVAVTARDFVMEWLTAPWEESRTRSESASLEQWHGQLYREDGVGDFPDPTLRCTLGSDLWQVGTYFYNGPKRYFRVRWQAPFNFFMVGISETPYPDCTVADPLGNAYPQLFENDVD